MRTLEGMEERTITLNSFSKNFLMTGWRIGMIISDPAFAAVIKNINTDYIYTAPSISQRAAIKALEIREDIKKTYISKYRERVEYSSKRLEAVPYLSLVPPGGTFYIFPGIQKTGLTSAEFTDQLLERAHILVTPGTAFGPAGEGHFRISCTVPKYKLKEALDRMEKLSF
jgi:aspartate/methionine/tyrosine aminotransferase